MRITSKRFLDHRDVGKTRVITKFALWPITIYNQTRWLERVTYEERVDVCSFEFKIYRWIPFRFID
jgi:hypothetical protein